MNSRRNRYEQGQWIVPTQADLFTERDQRHVMPARREATEVTNFLLPLPAWPRSVFEEWTILELSRARPDSHCLRMDICRVASFYLHQWTGLAPLPTDPKPR